MDEMAARVARMRLLLPALERALNSFVSSSAAFRIVRTVNPSTSSKQGVESSEPQVGSHPKSLFILDSSYNPPSRAHLALASSALSTSTEPLPQRLLLLFSVHNADKSPSPASFAQRLAMMVLFAEDLQRQRGQKAGPSAAQVAVDIGLTTSPYYTDKSTSISSADPSPYPSSPTHIHLLGYDTLTRFLAPKYYSKYTPPLSALEPFFGPGHKLMVLLRPESSSDNAVTGETEEEQREYVRLLGEGSLEEHGLNRQWAKQIGILEGEDVAAAAGISSTVVRKAAKNKEWLKVEQTCTPSVAEWIRDQSLYDEG